MDSRNPTDVGTALTAASSAAVCVAPERLVGNTRVVDVESESFGSATQSDSCQMIGAVSQRVV